MVDVSELRSRVLSRYEISRAQFNEMISETRKLLTNTAIRKVRGKLEEEINSFMYTPNELHAFGKEYWFFLFTGNKENFRDQLMISFGRNKNNSMKIDDSDQLLDCKEYLGGIGEIWYSFKGQTVKFGKLGGKITYGSDFIQFETPEYSVRFSGYYPEYKMTVTQDSEEVISITSKLPEAGDSIEFFNFEKANLGSEIGNAYLDFSGTIEGNAFHGRNYLQKVIMSAPFIPWYWGRFIFDSGSVLVFFLMWVEMSGVKRTVYSQLKLYDIQTKEYVKIDDYKIEQPKGTNYFIITQDSEESNFFALIHAYANNVFSMSATGVFTYDEMFAEVKELRFVTTESKYTTEILGKGVGSLEKATGMAF
ncbi:MAG: hypothetical protein INQ03_02710 [Candidatus Heimdallarchaeota archaeon]|nr:hypothetical protein [Candidatus Heimdallarchaeota archaeon]